jgi:hypothetical protein
MLGGKIDWFGVEVLCEMLGVMQPEHVIRGLIQIRKHFEDKDRAALLN